MTHTDSAAIARLTAYRSRIVAMCAELRAMEEDVRTLAEDATSEYAGHFADWQNSPAGEELWDEACDLADLADTLVTAVDVLATQRWPMDDMSAIDVAPAAEVTA